MDSDYVGDVKNTNVTSGVKMLLNSSCQIFETACVPLAQGRHLSANLDMLTMDTYC